MHLRIRTVMRTLSYYLSWIGGNPKTDDRVHHQVIDVKEQKEEIS